MGKIIKEETLGHNLLFMAFCALIKTKEMDIRHANMRKNHICVSILQKTVYNRK